MSKNQPAHPRQALFDAEHIDVPALPACDHYAAAPVHMRKALLLQAEYGPVFDVTLGLQADMAAGADFEQAHRVSQLLDSPDNRHGRVGVRLLPVGHRHFADTAGIVLRASQKPAYLMCPQPQGLANVQRAADVLAGLGAAAVPLHVMIETHGALCDVWAIASHPRIECLSFGLMDFVAAHRGAIPASAMTGAGQFDHPLVVRAKLEIAAACHAAGITPSHCAYADMQDLQAMQAAADMAGSLLGYTRMCSIHPAQIRPILAAFEPGLAEVEKAINVLHRAHSAGWGPIAFDGQMQDHASYRVWWHLLERAQRILPAAQWSALAWPADELRHAWFAKA